jgi:hypothetical protein
MKTYKIVLFTASGLKTEIYKDFATLEGFENQMKRKYGTFIMQSSEEIQDTTTIKTPINYPCVMLEKKNTIGVNVSEETLYKGFVLIENEKDFYHKIQYFDDAVICQYHSVINKAIEISNQTLIFTKQK